MHSGAMTRNVEPISVLRMLLMLKLRSQMKMEKRMPIIKVMNVPAPMIFRSLSLFWLLARRT